MRHVYSVVRFVPDPARGEAVNVGIIAGADESGEWTLRTVGNYSRARRLDDRELLPGVRERLERLEALVERYTDAQRPLLSSGPPEIVDEQWLAKLSSESANVLQFTWPLPVVAENAEEAIELLWDRLVVESTAKITLPFAKKHQAVSAFSRALKSWNVPNKHVVRRTEVWSESFRAPMDFAIHNGHVTQLTNCWSFQLPDKERLMEEITSWAWAVRDLRRNGGSVTNHDEMIEIAGGSETAIYVIYVPPVPGQEADERAFESARSAFEDVEVGARHVRASKANSVAQDAAQRLGIS